MGGFHVDHPGMKRGHELRHILLVNDNGVIAPSEVVVAVTAALVVAAGVEHAEVMHNLAGWNFVDSHGEIELVPVLPETEHLVVEEVEATLDEAIEVLVVLGVGKDGLTVVTVAGREVDGAGNMDPGQASFEGLWFKSLGRLVDALDDLQAGPGLVAEDFGRGTAGPGLADLGLLGHGLAGIVSRGLAGSRLAGFAVAFGHGAPREAG